MCTTIMVFQESRLIYHGTNVKSLFSIFDVDGFIVAHLHIILVITRTSLVFVTDSSSENCDTMEQLNKMIRKFESLSATKTTPDSSGSQNRMKPNSSETNSYIERLRLNNAIRYNFFSTKFYILLEFGILDLSLAQPNYFLWKIIFNLSRFKR